MEEIAPVSAKTKQFQCKICKNIFSHNSDMKRHVQTHTPLETRNKVKCDMCSKFLICKKSLKEHIERVHKKVKKFQCETCHKLFHNKGGYKEHKEIVHENKRTINYTTL